MSVDLITQVVAYAIAIVGAARLIVQGIAKVTAITPSTTDDQIVSTAQKWIARVQSLLGTIALPSNGAETTAAKKKAKTG